MSQIFNHRIPPEFRAEFKAEAFTAGIRAATPEETIQLAPETRHSGNRHERRKAQARPRRSEKLTANG